MLYYEETGIQKEYYIVKYNVQEGTITFADGSVDTNIEMCEKNISKLNAQLEQQKNIAFSSKIDEKISAKNHQNSKRTNVMACTTGLLITMSITSQLNIALSAGVVSISAILFAKEVYKLNRSRKLSDELEGLKFRDAHQGDLARIKYHHNPLMGVSRKTKKLVEQEKDPFIINNYNIYKDDLETIVSNIEREKSLNLTYKRNKEAK